MAEANRIALAIRTECAPGKKESKKERVVPDIPFPMMPSGRIAAAMGAFEEKKREMEMDGADGGWFGQPVGLGDEDDKDEEDEDDDLSLIHI